MGLEDHTPGRRLRDGPRRAAGAENRLVERELLARGSRCDLRFGGLRF
jgi:hypothetical protein